ncbi:MAG: hypothetical protein WC877_08605 [Dehalococcoidales bacterium]
MNKYSYIGASIIPVLMVMTSILSSCSAPTPETVISTSTAWSTNVYTTTISNPTTTTVTLSETITSTLKITSTSTVTVSPTSSSTTNTSTNTSTTDPYNHYRGYLLEGYPEDIWPLYGKLAIDSCALDIQFPSYNSMGIYFNSYSVVYITDKTKEEIAEYYTALLDTREESTFYDAIGTISGYEVDARWDEWSGENIVYLSVLLPNTLNITGNPFHADFPESLQNLYQLGNMWSEYYVCTSNPPAGTIISAKLFSHTGTYEDAIEYYRALYSDKQDYTETVTQESGGPSTRLKGVIDELTFTIIIGVWGNPDMIQVSYQTAS